VSFINIWLKRPNLRHSRLCLSGGNEIHLGWIQGHKLSTPNPQYNVAQILLLFMIYDLFISYCFLLSFLKLKFWGDYRMCIWIWRENLSFLLFIF